MRIHTYKSKEDWLKLRMQDITSTEVSALFGVNPYFTKFELWHRKKKQEIVSIEETERMSWGKALEDAIAKEFARQNNWDVAPFKDYARHDTIRAGSSFDWVIDNADGTKSLLEIKNLDFFRHNDTWTKPEGEDEVEEAPLFIELQLQHQFLITGWENGYIGALIGGNEGKLLNRGPQKEIQERMIKEIEEFWWSINNNVPPKPDWEADADFIAELYTQSTENLTVSAIDDEYLRSLAHKYSYHGKEAREHEKKKKAAKAEMLTKIGSASAVLGEDFKISAKTTAPTVVESYTRKGFRNFRVTVKKGE